MARDDTTERPASERRDESSRNEDRRGAQVAHEDLRGDERLGDRATGAGTEEDAFDEGPERSHTADVRELTREQVVRQLSLREIETLTGLPSPEHPSPDEEREYRLLAWENVKLDVEARDEWGGVNPDSDPETTPRDEHDRPPGMGDADD